MLTDDFDLYYDFKYLESCIFCEIAKKEYSISFIGIDTLLQLRELVSDNRFMFDTHATNNIGIILEDIRYIEDENTLRRNEIINDIINLINTPYNKKENYDFYRMEICQRLNSNKYLRLSEKVIDAKRELFDTSIAFDSVVLHTHTIDENAFFEYFDGEVNNPLYQMSVRAIINEFPLILKNETFLNRLYTVLNKEDTKGNKKLIKDIRKMKRKF